MARARLMEVVAAFSGRPLNASAIGRELSVSRTTASEWIHSLDKLGLIRLLPFYGGRHKPLLILPRRDNPASQILDGLVRTLPECRLYWWKSGRVRVVPLLVDVGGERIGICFFGGPFYRNAHVLPLRIAWELGIINRGFLLHGGEDARYQGGLTAHLAKAIILALPLDEFARELRDWILVRTSWKAARAAVWRINARRRPSAEAAGLAPWASRR